MSLPAASLTHVLKGEFSLTGTEPAIHEPLRPAKDAAIHTLIHGDSKPLPNNRTAKVLLFLLLIGTSHPKRLIFTFF